MTMMDNDDWALAEGELEGAAYIYRFRQGIPQGIQPSDFPHVVTILWPYDGSGYNGMPKPEVQEPMGRFEQAASSIEGPPVGFFMVTITGNNRKDWIWYVRDTDAFMSELNRVLASHERYPIEVLFSLDENWDDFRSFLSGTNNTTP